VNIEIALFEPEIPPNTGNISRLCVGLGSKLHIIGKAAFDLSEKSVRRAGLDYWKHLELFQHGSFQDFIQTIPFDVELYLVTKFADQIYFDVSYTKDSIFLFGNETSGVPKYIHEYFSPDKKIKIPSTDRIRSLNLSNSVAIIAYEALRQNYKKNQNL
jgi:tRNA (cytidine/uridine-2'-O-)-methyltransferase